jgi:hypothetical protein
VVEDYRPRTIDVEGLYREVRAFCAKGQTPEQRERADFEGRGDHVCFEKADEWASDGYFGRAAADFLRN